MRDSKQKERKIKDRVVAAVRAVAGNDGKVVSYSTKIWASVTFTGARHRMKLRFEGGEGVLFAEELVAFLPEHEFSIAGHLVADAVVLGQEYDAVTEYSEVECELLVLEGDT